MDITVVVPLFNEEESLPELYAWIERVMKANNFTYEVIFVNDGSTDNSWNVIESLSQKLATPFLVGKRLAAFRTQALYGVISFRRAYAYSLYVFIYASLVFALVQYAYFQFLDNGAFAELITTTMKQVAPVYEQNGVSKEEIKNSMDLITMITPVQWAFMFMMQNLFIGAIISLPIALIGKRNRY